MCEYYRNELSDPGYDPSSTLQTRVYMHAPLLVFLLLVLLLGVPMNLLVFYIYHFKVQSKIFGLFIGFLAWYDILYCCLMIPLIVSFKLVPEHFDPEVACRAITFGVLFSLVTGGIILIIIAVQRHRSICQVGGCQIDISLARQLVVLTPFLGVALSLPIIFPLQSEVVNITVTELITIDTYTCTLHSFSHSVLSFFVIALVLAEVSFVCVILSALYLAVWRTIRRQLRVSSSSSSHVLQASITSTKVFLVVSLVFCLSHLPPTFFMIISSQLAIDNKRTWTLLVRQLVDMAAYIHFINTIVNPLVYGVWCRAFRTECFKILGCAPIAPAPAAVRDQDQGPVQVEELAPDSALPSEHIQSLNSGQDPDQSLFCASTLAQNQARPRSLARFVGLLGQRSERVSIKTLGPDPALAPGYGHTSDQDQNSSPHFTSTFVNQRSALPRSPIPSLVTRQVEAVNSARVLSPTPIGLDKTNDLCSRDCVTVFR